MEGHVSFVKVILKYKLSAVDGSVWSDDTVTQHLK